MYFYLSTYYFFLFYVSTIYLSIYPSSMFIYVCYLSNYLASFLYIYLSTYLSIHPSIYPSSLICCVLKSCTGEIIIELLLDKVVPSVFLSTPSSPPFPESSSPTPSSTSIHLFPVLVKPVKLRGNGRFWKFCHFSILFYYIL